jgi:uncharacterized delta-60 repeat protein
MLHALAITRARRVSLVLALSFVCAAAAHAQDGANDPTFNTLDDGRFGEGVSFGGSSNSGSGMVLARQPDGRVWIGGQFSTLHGGPAGNIARLNADGSVDASFKRGVAATSGGQVETGFVRAIVLQPDGRALVAGKFDAYDGAPRESLARTLSDGALDPSFAAGSITQVNALALQPDGKLLIGGPFLFVGPAPRATVARLNSDGSLDASFDPGEGAVGNSLGLSVEAIALQPDGGVLVGGGFTSFGGLPRGRIARLLPNGSVDPSFDPGTGFDLKVFALALQPDGRVLVGGNFQSVNGVARVRVARLLSNGAVDPSFDPGSGANSFVSHLSVQPDGRVLAGGDFKFFGGAARRFVARLEANGALDTSFDPGPGADSFVASLALEPSGRVLMTGQFRRVAGTPRRGLARLEPNGAHDTSFSPGRGATGSVRALARRPDGKLWIGGDFDTYNDVATNRLALLETDGSLAAAFGPSAGPNGSVSKLVAQASGGVLVVGSFTTFDGAPRRSLARTDAQGALDSSFDAGTTLGGIADVVQQADGKLLVATVANSPGGLIRSVRRLALDGSIDASFQSNAVANNLLDKLALQPDGRVLLAGSFTTIGGVPRNRVARLNADGTLDASFDPGAGPNASVGALALEADGCVLISGAFSSVAGVPRGRVARLRSDGSLDAGSFTGVGANVGASGILPQLDGASLLRGAFNSYDGVPRSLIARVLPSGALDLGFDPGAGANGNILAALRDPGGDLVIAGDFTQYDGAVRHRIARVKLAWIDWVNYCTSGVSSQGCTPSISASGSASVSAPSGFTLDVQNVDGAKQGLIYYALGGRASTPLGAGNTSFFCVKAPLQRMTVQNSGGAVGSCNGVLQQDWLAFVSSQPSALGAPFAAGVNVQAQAWYRDPPAPKSVALSNALEFITVP